MQVKVFQFDLPLRHTFRISHESRTVQPTMIVHLQDDHGNEGYGEATVTTYYGVSMEGMLSAVERVRPWLETYEFTEPDFFYAERLLHAAFLVWFAGYVLAFLQAPQ